MDINVTLVWFSQGPTYRNQLEINALVRAEQWCLCSRVGQYLRVQTLATKHNKVVLSCFCELIERTSIEWHRIHACRVTNICQNFSCKSSSEKNKLYNPLATPPRLWNNTASQLLDSYTSSEYAQSMIWKRSHSISVQPVYTVRIHVIRMLWKKILHYSNNSPQKNLRPQYLRNSILWITLSNTQSPAPMPKPYMTAYLLPLL